MKRTVAIGLATVIGAMPLAGAAEEASELYTRLASALAGELQRGATALQGPGPCNLDAVHTTRMGDATFTESWTLDVSDLEPEQIRLQRVAHDGGEMRDSAVRVVLAKNAPAALASIDAQNLTGELLPRAIAAGASCDIATLRCTLEEQRREFVFPFINKQVAIAALKDFRALATTCRAN